MPQAVVAAGVAFATQAAVSAAIGIVSNFVVSSLFGPDEPEAPTPARRKITTAQADAARDIVYGRVRKGGTVSFHGVTHASSTVAFAGQDAHVYHYVVALAGHECDAIEEIWFGDYQLTLDVNGDETGDYAGVMRVRQHLGAWNQTADAELISAIPETASFRGRNVCYLYFQLLGTGKFANKQVENVSAVIRGRKIYQPRNVAHSLTDADTWEWSQNPTDCSADLHMGAPIRDKDGNLISMTGFRSDGARRIEWDKQEIFSQVCDETITIPGGTQPRFACNGVVSADEASSTQLSKVLSSMAGRAINFGGKYAFMPAYARTSVMSFGGDNFLSKPAISLGAESADLFTAAAGLYVDAERNYTSTNSNLVVSSTFETTLNGKRRTRELSLPFVDNHTQAERLCKLAVGSSSLQKTFSVLLDFSALALEVGDVVTITHETAGWVNKEFEVTHWVLKIDPDAEDNGVTVSLKEYDSDAFLWASGEATDLTNQIDSTIPSIADVPAPASITVDQSNYFTVGAVDFTAAAVTHAYPVRYEFRYRQQSAATYAYAGPLDSTQVSIAGLAFGDYVVEARAINSRGVPSAWTAESFTISSATNIPRPTYLRVIDGLNDNEFVGPDIRLDWNDVAISAQGLENSEAADTGANDAQFRSYELELYAGTLAAHSVLISRKQHKESQFTLTLDQNRAMSIAAGLSGPQRNLVAKVYTVLANGQRSEPSVLECFNSAPPSPTGISTSATLNAVFVDRTSGVDADLAGTIVRYSTTQGFDPALGEGSIGFQASGSIQFADLAEATTYYLRIADYDAFGLTGLNWSSELTVETATIAIDDASITEAKLAADAVTETKIADDAISSPKIVAGAVLATKIATGAVTADKVAANAITAVKIDAGAVTASKMSVTDLAAVNATLGDVEAGRIRDDKDAVTPKLDINGTGSNPYILLRSV